MHPFFPISKRSVFHQKAGKKPFELNFKKPRKASNIISFTQIELFLKRAILGEEERKVHL